MFERINQWMNTVGLKLAQDKTDISNSKQMGTINFEYKKHVITTKPFIPYLVEMLNARLNCKQQMKHVSVKVPVIRTILSILLPNVGGQSREGGCYYH